MSNQPLLFTIITPCYNAAATITTALDSVAAQDYPNYEYRIIDGASTDNTGESVHSRQSTFNDRLHFTSQPDSGIYDAMNKGLASAQGTYCLFLGADDRLEPGALTTAATLLTQTQADCLAGACRVIWPNGKIELRPPRLEMTTRPHPPSMPAIHQAWLARTQLLRALGGFNLSYHIAADYELYLRLQQSIPAPTWAFTQTPLATFTLGGASYDIHATAADYRRARTSHGQSRLSAALQYQKNILASYLVRLNFR